MNVQQFRQLAFERGYDDFQAKVYVPNNDGPLHTYAFSLMPLVAEGHFAPTFENVITNS